MRIKRIYIGDFGIFRNQTLDEIGPGIVVIGGLNRAGKSTFLKILRYLGYGFPQSDSLPPAVRKYEVESDVILDSGDIFNIRLTGYGEPIVNCIVGENNKIASARELYNNLDPFTYQQVFTISLDELQRIPNGVSRKEMEKLQSILLGAGLSDIVQIPQIEKALIKEAEKIGGKHGNPRVKEFKPYYQQIKAGIELRESALQQVEQYYNKQKELEKINQKIDEGEKELKELLARITALDLLKNNFEDYNKLKKLEIHLRDPQIQQLLKSYPAGSLEKAKNLYEEYKKIIEDYNKQLYRFNKEIAEKNISDVKEKLLKYKEELYYFYQQLSGLKEKVQNYLTQKEDCQQEKNELIAEMAHLNQAWEGDFDRVLKIKSDQLEQDRLAQTVEDYKKLQQEKRELEKDLTELKREQMILKNQLEEFKVSEPGKVIKRYFYLALLFTILGGSLSFINFTSGILIGVAGIIGAGAYLIYKYSTESSLRNQKQNLEIELKNIESRLLDLKTNFERVEKDINSCDNDLQRYRTFLGLARETSPELIKEYFRDIQDLKKRIVKWKNFADRIKTAAVELEEELKKMAHLVQELDEGQDYIFQSGELIKNSGKLFVRIEQAIQHLELALSLENGERLKENIEKKICQLMNLKDGTDNLQELLEQFIQQGEKFEKFSELKSQYQLLKLQILQALKTDRVRDAMEKFYKHPITDDQDLLQTFDRLFKEYTSLEDVQKAYEDSDRNLKSLEKELERLKEKRQTLKNEIEYLATTENLEKAQKQIDGARAELRLLAEKFAIYRAAAYILNQVQKRFIEKTKGELLSQASRILNQITNGEYKEILPPDNLIDIDFKIVLDDGVIQDTADILSRGTREQLFMAVRINRIQEIDPPLPVILDDSLVNFDIYHMDKVVELLANLAKSHQIFVMTCHSHLVECIAAHSPGAQYWKLEEGVFSISDENKLINYLRKR
ncbi:hypothetical protein BBF96_13660 [Anoxybacter fermentans]|uniref:Rad50/SbcC-type AAA domain-containing protein n=1 Tax=Anoxybacter fermentans TaxID=1323375 RepID=A0A3S9T1Q6_9FIRM|nr:AAA family ATPase [Anoxybacter fermentans]AZR74342.1 hypothetical protein BBF96_13660 [Anoxybacter fermentans]